MAGTFNNYFHPETVKAAVSVLEAAGFQVFLPKHRFCCGRPLYDFGMLDQAKRQLRQIMHDLHETILSGIPLVGLEPACVAVFRDELVNLFPHDEVARRLNRQTYFFNEFLVRKAPNFQYPKLRLKAVMHGHCHEKALIKTNHAMTVLGNLGLDCTFFDSGCCGMAGSFGFEKDKYAVSEQIGELVLMPAVREASSETLVIADGFSCREQIAQMAGRKSLHSAEVIRLALRDERRANAGEEC